MLKKRKIGIGVVGGGYMGKAHSVAMNAVGSVFNTMLRPDLVAICTTTEEGARSKADEFGFSSSTSSWRELVNNPQVEAVIVATPAESHDQIAQMAFELGKPVFCEKPLAATFEQAKQMTQVAEASGFINMTGFNYIRTPATQLAKEMIDAGEIGEITFFRGEHTEDFYADETLPATWRAFGDANGCLGDLAPHPINAALRLVGPISELIADVKTVIKKRPSPENSDRLIEVENDDTAQFLCRFDNGASGNLLVSRVAHGRKMGYIYEITGTKGALRFNQEDQNCLWYYDASRPAARQGFQQILTGPDHPDYVNFCLGPGHGTGYQDQIIIEAKDFLNAILGKTSTFPTFRDGLDAMRVAEAARRSSKEKRWIGLDEIY